MAIAERVEVLGEGLPLPVDALVQRGARDVLDAFHQLDEEVAPVGPHGGEADAAVAHDDGGDAVPARRRDLGIPRDLAVVVRVDVDPTGREEQAVAVELAMAAAVGVDVGDDVLAVDREIARTLRGARAMTT